MLLFSLVGLLALLVAYLWFISDHVATKGNYNLLWANPLFLYVLFRLRKTQLAVLYILAICLFTFLLGFWFLPQHFNTAIIPVALALLLRVMLLIYGKLANKKSLKPNRFREIINTNC